MKRLVIIIGFIFILNACFYSCKSTDTKSFNLKVYVLDGGSFIFNNSLHWFTLGDEYNDYPQKTLANTVFLIEHPNGRLLWDAGLEDNLADRKPEEIDTTAKLVYFVRNKLIDQLKSMKLTPDSLDYFVASHTHWDHVGNANYFVNSTWILDKNEYEWAMSEERKESSSYYDSLHNSKIIEFEEKYDVFKDGKVVIYSTPGHTPGHVSMYIKLEKRQSILISGDLYHFNEQREYKRVPSFNTDSLQTLESMEKFEKLATQLNARVIIPHEVTDYLELPKYPEYLE
jgi:glyoxylase-like metal-dependent hydrolase (beta-lactamase superfamily II)